MTHQRYGSGGPYEKAIGYSRVVVSGNPAAPPATAWTAGCTATIDGVVVAEGDPYAQTLAAFGVGIAALERAGFALADIVQTRMYVVDVVTHGAEVGRAHGALFADVMPASTMVGVAALIDPRMLVEVELVAVSGTSGSAGNLSGSTA
jgi:enamine deaminase RidA (YjgF/YER057c/UK114 family)